MPHTITWVATFNGAQARFYEWRRADASLAPLDLGVGPGDHRPIYSDRPIRTYASLGPGRGTGDQETDGERSLEKAYVGRIADALERHASQFDRLVIAAAPRALGDFRRAAAPHILDKVWQELHHDYVNTSAGELLDRLSEQCL